VGKRRNLFSEKVEALLEIKASFLEEEVQKTSPREDVVGNSSIAG